MPNASARFRAEPTPPATEMPQPKDEPPKVAVENDSKSLQAIFMTDEPLDLAKTIHKIAELPGLRSCILSTTDGLKLAGDLAMRARKKQSLAFLPELFQADAVEIGSASAPARLKRSLCITAFIS